MQLTLTPYVEGHSAFKVGSGLSANPYTADFATPSTRRWHEWNNGWFDARDKSPGRLGLFKRLVVAACTDMDL